MASPQKQYSAEFKAKVALKALAQDKKNLDRLSDKHDVPVSMILTWTAQLERNAAHVYQTSAEPTDVSPPTRDIDLVDVEIDDEEVSQSISYGVMGDELDYKKLTFWSVLGIVFLIIFTQLLFEMYDISQQVNDDRIAASSQYHDVNEQKEQARERLTNFGVVDIEEGIYRIPIDSVMNEMAVDGE